MIKCSADVCISSKSLSPQVAGSGCSIPGRDENAVLLQIPAHLHPIINFTLSMCFRRTLQASVNC